MEDFINPEEIISSLSLDSKMTAVDFGCGSGNWTIPLAKKLKDGSVIAIDLLEEPLSVLKSRAEAERVRNIKTLKADIESDEWTRHLSRDSMDLILLVNLLFQVEKKKQVLEEVKRILKPGGKALIVDWKETSPFGPKEKIQREELEKNILEIGLSVEREFDAGSHHYVLILTK